ncbi:5'-nucleotidase C-terminal domain-containing protein [Sphingobacterium sp. WQ 366]|uniref:5'-nucleotidase C-terminal domain-containing protein n=1 Tax=Sphingobacterium bovistauri TaxID=2781959 RepID=A0ABS7Z845_9SPHI|nr:5'-nucleotidase C-terminal domain-containing protein [Sphingobacterium bovistauri]
MDNSITADTSIVNYYIPFKQKLESEMNRVIGYSDNHLTRTRIDAESLAGNFFVDAMLEIGKSIDPNTQIAFANKFGIRADLQKGNITVGNIFELMPFENYFTILEISGNDLLTLIQYIAKTNGQPIAGITLEIKDGQAMNIKINKESIDSTKTYKIITYDYLANGGDYVVGLSNPLHRNDTGILVRFGLIDYIEKLTKAGKTINTELDGRVKNIK